MSGGELEQQVTVRRRGGFTVVSDEIYACHTLSIDARHVLGWMLGRGEGYRLTVKTILRVHGLKRDKWRGIRKQLVEQWFWKSTKWIGPGGRVCWAHEVSDDPLYTQKQYDNSRGGFTTDGGAMDGATIGGETGNVVNDVDLYEKHPDLAKPGLVRARARAGAVDNKNLDRISRRRNLVEKLLNQIPLHQQQVARAEVARARDQVALAQYFLKNGVEIRKLEELARPGESWKEVGARLRARPQRRPEPPPAAPLQRRGKRSAAADVARGKFRAALANLGGGLK